MGSSSSSLIIIIVIIIIIIIIITFVDMDGDGDLDYFAINNYECKYFENQGSTTNPNFVDVGLPTGFPDCLGEGGFAVAFNDEDDDGDWDLFFTNRGDFYYYMNEGDATTPIFNVADIQGAPGWNAISRDYYRGKMVFFPEGMTAADFPS